MTWLELKQWCKDNNVPDDAVLTKSTMATIGNGDMSCDFVTPKIRKINLHTDNEKRYVGITDTTPMVVEL